MSLLEDRANISARRPMPVQDVTSSTAVSDQSESVSFGDGAAGTAQYLKLTYDGILSANNDRIGEFGDTSLSFTTGTILTTEVPWRFKNVEGKDNNTSRLASMANGEYMVDYDNGFILGLNASATSSTTDTVSYSVRFNTASVTGGVGDASAANQTSEITLLTTIDADTGNIADSTGNIDVKTQLLLDKIDELLAAFIISGGEYTQGSDQVVLSGFTVDENNVLTITENSIGPASMTRDRKQIMASYDSSTDTTKTTSADPIWSHHIEETLADVTNETSATTYHYADMDGYDSLSIQINTGGTAPTDTLTITIEASNQDDGTAAASCFYTDITTLAYDAATGAVGTASWVDVDMMAFLAPPVAGTFKYVRVKTVTAGGSNDQDYTIYIKKAYI